MDLACQGFSVYGKDGIWNQKYRVSVIGWITSVYDLEHISIRKYDLIADKHDLIFTITF